MKKIMKKIMEKIFFGVIKDNVMMEGRVIRQEKEVICGLAKASEIIMKPKDDKEIKEWLSSVVNERMDVFLDIKDKIDLENELKRLNKNRLQRPVSSD